MGSAWTAGPWSGAAAFADGGLMSGGSSNTQPCPARLDPGRPAAHPTAAGWDKELLGRTAGVRLPRPRME